MKHITRVTKGPEPHWVGDGFHVRSVITPRGGKALGPFVLMDYAGPEEFGPSSEPRGVDTHPHKGFETVTVVFQGELEHRDSAGNSGKIGPGDVQWMTAASGILHEEKHSQSFTEQGGVLEMAQIWVNLPAKHKEASPRYQTLLAQDIPVIELPDSLGSVKVIAGDFDGTPGAAETFTPVTIWAISIQSAGRFTLPIPEGHPGGVYVRQGSVMIGEEMIHQAEFAEFAEEGAGLHVEAPAGAELLVLAGEPINEPMVAYGPFVMNSMDEIQQAMMEFRAGKYGTLV
ncbi:pirin family protein [Kamptonema cortianum]|nr:pirin family protein [Geitlerinema splendidum]MDK3158648.1 pirin family protein [Kamptonema cortianum]